VQRGGREPGRRGRRPAAAGRRDGAGADVAAYEFKNKTLSIKSGWPVMAGASTESYEVRGLAAADLDGDGSIEVVATTTVGGLARRSGSSTPRASCTSRRT